MSIQSFSQTDTEFWFAAPAITPGHENKPIVLRITSYDKPAVITISQPANPSFVPIVFSLNSNATVTKDLSSYLALIETSPSGTIVNSGIKISSTANITAYYEVGNLRNPEIFTLKGNTAKGTSFIIPTQNQFDNRSNLIPPANNGFVIVATEDNTTIDINLTQPDGNGHPSGSFRIILNKGQTYAVIGNSTFAFAHLGGSEVKSNKPICITVYDDSVLVSSSYDLAGDQIVPIFNTGTEFIIVRGALSAPTYTNTDFYFIYATEDGTAIYENGSTVASATINKGGLYKGYLSSNSVYVTSSKPVYVLQFTGVGTEVTETSLPSIKCTGSNSVSFVRSTNELFYLNLICKSEDIGNFSLNGVTGIINPILFFDVPGAVGWKAARINTSNLTNLNTLIPNGSATSITNSTGLFHLGFLNGSASSGARLGYFSNYSKVSMTPNLTSSACIASDIQLASRQINNVIYKWTGPNQFSSNIYNPIIPNAGFKDSGYYYLEATVPGCGTSIDSIYIKVNPLPTIQLVKPSDTLCLGTSKPIAFNLSGTAPWDLIYTDGLKTDTLKNIKNATANLIVQPTNFTIYQFQNIIDSNACNLGVSGNVVDSMFVNKLPIANFDYAGPTCEKNAIGFTNLSTAHLDTVTQWHWDMGDGNQMNRNNGLPFNYQYAQWGKDTVKLSVVSSLGCKSDTVLKVLDIKPLPNLGFILPNVCLDGGLAIFKDTSSSIEAGSLFSYKWNFNAGANPITPGPSFNDTQLVASNPSVLYNAAGNYLVQLQLTTQFGCIDSLSKIFTINGSNPIANFKVLKDTALCSNEAVVIKDSSWVYPGRVGVLHINWGDGKDTLINEGKIGALYNHTYTNAVASANYNYLIKVQAYSGGTCYDDSTRSISIVKPVNKVVLAADKDFLCIQDSLLIQTSIIGGVAPFNYALNTNNPLATVKGDYLYGVNNGIISVGVQVTDAKNCTYPFTNLLNLTIPVLPVANLIVKDSVICNGDSVTLKGQGANLFKWIYNTQIINTTSVDSLVIGKSGNYSLIVNDGKCNSLPTPAFSIIDFTIPSFNFNYYPYSCTNGDLFIRTNTFEKYKIHYTWDFGDSSYYYKSNPISHSYKKKGKYLVQLNVNNDYCPKYEYRLVGDTIQIVDPLPSNNYTLFVLADQDTIITPKRIDPQYTQYSWFPTFSLNNPNSLTPTFNGSHDIAYSFQMQDPLTGCKIIDTYQLNVSNDVVIAIPKAFTPNHDNLNDLLKIESGAGVKMLKSFIIFNRFGKIVFQTNDINNGWDGRYNGYDQEMDAYSYVIEYITYKDIPMRKTGSFILLR